MLAWEHDSFHRSHTTHENIRATTQPHHFSSVGSPASLPPQRKQTLEHRNMDPCREQGTTTVAAIVAWVVNPLKAKVKNHGHAR